MIRGTWIDDRPPRMPAFYGDLNDKVKSLRVRYGHLTPRHYTINDDV
jgi:hypothetical protein